MKTKKWWDWCHGQKIRKGEKETDRGSGRNEEAMISAGVLTYLRLEEKKKKEMGGVLTYLRLVEKEKKETVVLQRLLANGGRPVKTIVVCKMMAGCTMCWSCSAGGQSLLDSPGERGRSCRQCHGPRPAPNHAQSCNRQWGVNEYSEGLLRPVYASVFLFGAQTERKRDEAASGSEILGDVNIAYAFHGCSPSHTTQQLTHVVYTFASG